MIVVKVWRRHGKKCPHKSNRYYRKCNCRVWLEWGSKRKRKSAKTRSWQEREKLARRAEEGFKRAAFGEESKTEAVTVEHAAKSFVEAKKDASLAHPHAVLGDNEA